MISSRRIPPLFKHLPRDCRLMFEGLESFWWYMIMISISMLIAQSQVGDWRVSASPLARFEQTVEPVNLWYPSFRFTSHYCPYQAFLFLTFDFFTEAPRPRPKRLRTDSLLSVSVKLIVIGFIAENPVTIGQTTWVNGEQCLISDEHRWLNIL